jgi:serine/threonine protein kinase
VRDPLLGQQVGDYFVESFIGEGTMGVVYRAIHTGLGTAVVLKLLRAQLTEDPNMVSRLIHEAQALNSIRHPGIVDILGFGQIRATGQPYIVMEHVEGIPLDVVIRERGPMTLSEAFPILDELLSALAAAHAVGVIHRDVKPGNIVMAPTPEGHRRLKLLDFGLARQAPAVGGSVRPTNPGSILGTPDFMAPEQVRGTDVRPATDLYAVGGIAYQMLSGHLPHEGASAIEIISAKLRMEPPSVRGWTPDLGEATEALVMSLLRRDEGLRPQSAQEVRTSLALAMDEAGTDPGIEGVIPSQSWATSSSSGDGTLTSKTPSAVNATDRFPPVEPRGSDDPSSTIQELSHATVTPPPLRADMSRTVPSTPRLALGTKRVHETTAEVRRPSPTEAAAATQRAEARTHRVRASDRFTTSIWWRGLLGIVILVVFAIVGYVLGR